MTRFFSRLILIALVAMCMFSSCKKDIDVVVPGLPGEYVTILIVAKGGDYNIGTKGDEPSAVGSVTPVTDVHLVFLDDQDIVVNEHTTDATTGIIKVSIQPTVNRVMAFCNTGSCPVGNCMDMTYSEICSKEFALNKQVDVKTVAVVGENFLDWENKSVTINVTPVPARLEISKVTVDGLYNAKLVSLYMTDIYRNAALNATTCSDCVRLCDYEVGANGSLPVLSQYPEYYTGINQTRDVGVYTPKNGVWAFQALPAEGLVPRLTFEFKIKDRYKYVSFVPDVDMIQGGMVYKLTIDIDESVLSNDPNNPVTETGITVIVNGWEDADTGITIV